MVLQVPQDGKNFSGHMFIGLIVELPAKATALTKRDSLEKASHLQLFKKLHHFINEEKIEGNDPIFDWQDEDKLCALLSTNQSDLNKK